MLDPNSCYRALTARDARFDGVFFVAVRTTGIYCRPICSARTPKRESCSFFRSGAEAERAGFRACLRCRPELAPGNAPIDAVPDLVRRAVARIEAGYLDTSDVEALAGALGVTGRHLRRSMERELGVGPIELAQSKRLALAKQLLQDTRLDLAQVAFASGFKSIRRFNSLFRDRCGFSPSELRRGKEARAAGSAIPLRLDFRPPLDWDSLLAFFRDRALPGVESVTADEYRRVVRLGGALGTVGVWRDPGRPSLRAEVSMSLSASLVTIVARLRALFDLDARPDAVARALESDALLAPLVRSRPGLRVPGAFDGFESAARVVLGQQVSVAAARTLAGRLVARWGDAVAFPSAAELAARSVDELASVGMPGRRAETLRAVAASFARDPEAATAPGALDGIAGLGDWSRECIRMRAGRDPDAFPAGDLGLKKALPGHTIRQISQRAEAWRPWRAYAVMHLWMALTKGESK
ncbi:MAG: DNA-3-methyladenine glycosylase 2 family protein [Candidatus Wallbacteria bacterium]|nr:DNA-3-methyladenine glycosylase 2 family protein [Candidatus Wallbacteria bacterium]